MLFGVKTRPLLATIAAIFVFFSFAFAVVTPSPVFAADDGPNATENTGGSGSDDGGGGGGIRGFLRDVVTETIPGVIQGLFGFLGKLAARGLLMVANFGIFLLGVAGVLLDSALLLSFNMGAILAPGTSAGQAIAAGWTAIRDLINLIFIAGLVWASIAMILQMGVPGGNAGKFIANLIIAALLVNFSYFFAGAAVDVSNTLSQRIYEQALTGNSIQVRDLQVEGGGTVSIKSLLRYIVNLSGTTDEGYLGFIGSRFVNETNLASVVNEEVLERATDNVEGGDVTTNILFQLSMALVFIGATIEIFISMAFTIFGRFLLIIMLLITSPLMVLRFVGVEPLVTWGKQWWKAFAAQLIFLPIFVFLVSISFTVMHGFVQTLGATNLSLGSFGDPDSTLFVNALATAVLFIMSWGLLRISLSLSQTISQGEPAKFLDPGVLQKKMAEWGGSAGLIGKKIMRSPFTAGLYLGGKGLEIGGNLAERAKDRLARRERNRPIRDFTRRMTDWARSPESVLERDLPGKRRNALYEAIRDGNDELADKILNDRMTENERKDAITQAPKDVKEGLDNLVTTGQTATKKEGDKKTSGTDGDTNEGDNRIDGATGGEVGAEQTKTLNALLTETKKQGILERRQHFRANRNALLDIASEKAGVRTEKQVAQNIQQLKAALGRGGLGNTVPPELIIESDNILGAMDEHDLAAVRGRDDVSRDQYNQIRQRMSASAEGRGVLEKHDSAPSGL